MGHIVFLFLHLMAVMFGFVLLMITIPAHLIYAASKGGKPSRWTHVKCPACAEFVKREAKVCRHCYARLRA